MRVSSSPSPARLVALTCASLLGFAANSLLCRAALGACAIDAASFTAIRLAAGAVMLAILASRAPSPDAALDRGHSSWASAAILFTYAMAFSFAYLRLGAGTGALLLFGAVQATMIGWSLVRGERPRPLEWCGLASAAAGLIVLTAPGLTAPDPLGAALMMAAGIGWGAYSLRGRDVTRPLAANAGNFARSLPMIALVSVPLALTLGAHVTPRGAILAVASGALASGVGYSFWYAALPHLTRTRAATVQLSVPVLATVGGVLFLGEHVTARLGVASAAILGGIAVAVLTRRAA